MSKNKTMRLGAVLLVLALLTSAIIGGTLAKYTASTDSSDTARIAVWGFDEETKIEIENLLFATSYTDPADEKTTVDADVNVIAPGTEGEVEVNFLAKDGVTPEVAYEITFSTEGSEAAEDIQNNKNIVWSLDGTAYDSWEDFLAAIEDLSEEVEPNHLPANDGKHIVSWEWLFEDANADQIDASDEVDTAAGNADEDLNVTLVISVTATQID